MRIQPLRDLARSLSIETTYIDATGKRQQASREALLAAVDVRRGKRTERAVEPVTVVWGTAKPTVTLASAPTERVEWDLLLEDGSWRSGRTHAAGNTVTLDETLPFGYHTLHLHTGGKSYGTFVIAAPPKAYAPRQKTWGLFLPLYAARTRRSWGAGDLGDLLQYAQFVDQYGGGVVATLPMLAAFDDEPSPYSPVSRLFWNELYLDVTRVPEFDPTEVDHGVLAHLQQLKDVDPAAVMREKRRVLERCAARFIATASFERFAETAREYAEFRARIEQRDSAAYHLYVQYRMSQQLREAANAAQRLGSGLYLDFPLGTNPGGYDAWRYAEAFAKNVSVGAPPDGFFTKGQNWGFPPFDPDAIREQRYDYFRAAVRNHVTHAGVLRIDHVMGLHRLYWIPNGADAKDGVYVRYREEELYAILTLESRRHGCVIVGEDLGTVPPEVPKMMARHGLRRMYVVQYEIKPQEEPVGPPPAASVASVNTHDMPTFAGFYSGHDIDDRVAQGLLDERGATQERETREAMRRRLIDFLVQREYLTHGPTQDTQRVLEAVQAFLASTDAEIVLVNLEDLWGELVPQNVPGVPARSWRHKLRMGLEEMQADGSIRRVLTNVAARRNAAVV
ncbi:MAG: 4-alpha-glucanotransferase [Acidobacteriota bacterium]|jgi:4-alpha-glucanotransferase|nr:4-alpha-glucanotransferase [Acidobacteriota bacterium]